MRRVASAALAGAMMLGVAQAATVNVSGVASNDTLALRAQPDAKSAKVGQLPPNATGVAVVAVDTKGVDWVKVQKGNQSGWVNAKFLQYETTSPVKMTCSGTEPFWGMNVGYGFAVFEFDGKKTKLALDEPETPGARPNIWLSTVHGKPGQFLLATRPDREKCSDGMSDNVYPYTMLVRAGGVFMEGCCK